MTHDMKHNDMKHNEMRRNNMMMTAGTTGAWAQFFA